MLARRGDQVDNYHGELVADPYRWLEDTNDPETAAWIRSQNEATEAWLEGVPARGEIRAQLTELWDYPRYGVPFERGGRRFEERNSGLENQAVLYVMDGPSRSDGPDHPDRPDDPHGAAGPDHPHGEGRVLLDPNLLSVDGTVSVPDVEVTKDGELIAYATSEAGSDWMTWHVREVTTGLDRPDTVQWSKYSTASWRADGSGFYYTGLDRPAEGREYLDKAPPRRVMFHRLGTSQEDDEVVFEAPDQPEWGSKATVSEDGRYVAIQIYEGTAPESQLHMIDLEKPELGLRELVGDFSSKVEVVTNRGSTFYLVTDDGAERQRLVAVDLEQPDRAAWREVIPEAEALLLAARNCGGRLLCHYLADACSRLSVFSFEGEHLHDIAIPPLSALLAEHGEVGVEGGRESDVVHFAVTSFTDSGSIWRHDLATGETRLVRASTARFDPDELVSEQVFVTADDGTSIPLFLTSRRDVAATGDVPVLLYGYGGFDIAVTPTFRVPFTAFVERGGVLAVACLRGGGEYGRAWHEAGARQNKQRVFDDFCDCARWLSSSGWSAPEHIAILGGSNGGLLVGACLTQHPELFGAAVAEVGVLDMLRFHKFTIGWAWKSDFGDPDDPEQYRWVRAYSPLHHVEAGRRYPPVLLTTGDHDDRVIPGHSFKFGAALQAARGAAVASEEGTPVLVRVETSAGHGLGMPTSKAIAKATDVLSFVEASLGF